MKSAETKKVLIVEDEPIFRMNYRTVLEEKGYSVIEASTGQQGLHMITSDPPDIVLLDLILPEVNGYEVLKRIRETNSEIPIIVFSVLSGEMDMKRAFELGAQDYVIKGAELPISILDKIEALM
ncbi:response regulator [bacterium]|nr:response regulator [bacterium]